MAGWAQGITAIHYVPDLGDTPARVNRKTGEMEISMKHWGWIPKDIRLLIMLHEMAHCVLQTTDEVACDAWAFKKYAEMGHSLKASVKALTSLLDEDKPDHWQRMLLQYQRAKMYDYLVNGNKKVLNDEPARQ